MKAAWKVEPEAFRVAVGRGAAVVVDPPPAVVLVPPVLVFFDELHPAMTTTPSVANAVRASRRLRRWTVTFIQVLPRDLETAARDTPTSLSSRHGRKRR
jgi:hypothetical protein